jgi:DNA-directed RNA polymerase subunit RPC12/RpoP
MPRKKHKKGRGPRGFPADETRKAQAIQYKLQGLTYQEIGDLLSISRQRAQQLVRPPRAIYDLVRKKANYKCQECQVEIKAGHVHHEDRDDYNDIANLVYLCVSCHKNRHVWLDIDKELQAGKEGVTA